MAIVNEERGELISESKSQWGKKKIKSSIPLDFRLTLNKSNLERANHFP